MGLLKGESWDDYVDEDVFVSFGDGKSGFLGILKRWNKNTVIIEHHDTGEEYELPHSVVFGTWMLDGW